MAQHGDMAVSNPLIVVVDDDAAVRNSLKFSLEIDGYSVLTFASADDLLHDGGLMSCRCLIVDQNMPRMEGLEFIAALRKQGISTPAILISGHLTPALLRQAAGAGIPVVEKPFLENKLIESIRAAIDSV